MSPCALSYLILSFATTETILARPLNGRSIHTQRSNLQNLSQILCSNGYLDVSKIPSHRIASCMGKVGVFFSTSLHQILRILPYREPATTVEHMIWYIHRDLAATRSFVLDGRCEWKLEFVAFAADVEDTHRLGLGKRVDFHSTTTPGK